MRRYVTLAPLLILTLSCQIDIGNQASHSDILGVPYRQQLDFNTCTAAAVSMWRLYDRLPEVSESDIFTWEGGHAPNQLVLANAVRNFTSSGSDANWNVDTDQLNAATKQIASFNNAVPSIAIVGINHVGVIDGGTWYSTGDGRAEWDTVFFHDPNPAIGPDHPFVPGQWLAFSCGGGGTDCEGVLSASATAGWFFDRANYNNRVSMYGSTRGFNNPPPM